MITRHVGKGSITYLGAVLDPDLMRKVVAWATAEAQLEPEFPAVPTGVEVCRRVDAGHTIFVLINHGSAEQQVALPSAMSDVLHDGRRITSVNLDPQGVAVLAANAVDGKR
jgi:beta-galactosidase